MDPFVGAKAAPIAKTIPTWPIAKSPPPYTTNTTVQTTAKKAPPTWPASKAPPPLAWPFAHVTTPPTAKIPSKSFQAVPKPFLKAPPPPPNMPDV